MSWHPRQKPEQVCWLSQPLDWICMELSLCVILFCEGHQRGACVTGMATC